MRGCAAKVSKIPIILMLLASTIFAADNNKATNKDDSDSNIQTTITGVSDQPLTNAQNRITAELKYLPTSPSRQQLQAFLPEAEKAIATALQPYGYFEAKVSGRVQYSEGKWQLSFNIHPGPRVHIIRTNVNIIGPGQLLPAYQHLMEHMPFKNGSPLNTETYDNFKQKLFDIASKYGFFDAIMETSQIQINLKKRQAVVTILFNTGPRFAFGHTYFNPVYLNQQFLRRYLGYQVGEPYNNKKIQTTQQALSDSGYFNTVIMTPEIKQSYQRYIPIHVHLKEKNSQQYSIGAGYGTDTGIRGILAAEIKPINSWGHYASAIIRASTVNSYAVASYNIPGKRPALDLYTFSIGGGSQNWIAGQSRSVRGAITYSTTYFGWRQVLSLAYLTERYNLKNLPFTDTHMLLPSLSLQRTRANNVLNPSKGYSIALTFSGASKQVLSKTSFFQAVLNLRGIYTFHKNTRILLRGSLGNTSINDVTNLPLSLQLLAGGPQSVRGYSFQSLGPGKALYVGSVELQQRIKGDWYLGAFLDSGNVTNTFFKDMQSGAGPAIAWSSPVGLFELSFAKVLSTPKNSWRIQFSMGPFL